MTRLLVSLACCLTILSQLSAQSVGVGTTTPHASAALEVTSTTKGMLIPRMTTAQRVAIASPAAGLLVFDITTNSFWFREATAWTELVGSGEIEVFRNGPDRIYMGLTDSVGVGTMTPKRKLDVQTANADYGISHRNDSIEIATYVENSNGGWIGTVSQHPFRLYAGDGYWQFTVLPNGNLGANVVTPNNRMDIAGNISRTGTHAVNRPLYVTGDLGENQNGIEFRHTNGTQGIGFGFSTIYATGSSASQNIGLAARGATGNLLLYTNSLERARINGAGQMMIGTTEPAQGHLLSVGGKIAAEEILVDLEGDWPDYVFESSYPLPSLSGLRSFIDRNGHLPGIPAAATVEAEGIRLGEMQAALLEKIEELTLYILQQEERILRLESALTAKR